MVVRKSTEGTKKRETAGIVIREKRSAITGKQPKAGPDLRKELTSQLDHLRIEGRQICEAYLANLDADIAMLVDFLEDSSDVKTSAARKMNTLKAWANTLDGLNTKPAKGRRKDLRRLDEAIRTMMKSAFG